MLSGVSEYQCVLVSVSRFKKVLESVVCFVSILVRVRASDFTISSCMFMNVHECS